MRSTLLVLGLALLSACASHPRVDTHGAQLARGRELVTSHCAACHAVAEEALTKGVSMGHPAMPTFQFAPTDVNDVVVYLRSIQEDGDAAQ